MADLNEAVYSALSGDGALGALVGARIWNTQRSEADTLPSLVFQRVSTFPVNSSDGVDGLAGVRYQLDAYASTLASASSVIYAARDAILGTLTGVVLSRQDLSEDESRAFRIIMDVSVWGTDE